MARTTHRLTKGEKILLLCIALFVALIGGGGWWWVGLNATPQVEIPEPVMPEPNALSYYIKAGETLVEADRELFAPEDPYVPLSKEILAALQRNEPALAILREGFAYEYREEPQRSLLDVPDYYREYRSLARVLIIDSRRKAEMKDWNGAMQSRLDGLHLGLSFPRGGPSLPKLMGIACVAITLKDVWPIVPHLSGPEAKAAAIRLEAMRRLRVPTADTLEEEKWLSTASILELFRSEDWRETLFPPQGDADRLPLQAYFVNKRRFVNEHIAFMDALISNARLPYTAHPPAPPVPDNPFHEELAGLLEKLQFRDVQMENQDGLLLVTLALHAYLKEKKTYPDTLDALVPGYLQALPRDPFAASGTFQYRKTAKGHLLYSIGPDGKDDGGTPCKEAQLTNGKFSDPMTATSIGDVVAGVNLQ